MKIFASAVNCMDGRIQEPVINYLKSNFGVDYVDMITESGPDRILAENSDKYRMNSIKQRLEISVNNHGSEIILIAGHVGCTTNPVEKETHIAQILQSAAALKNWFPEVQIIPVWIGDDWIVDPL